MKRFLTFLTAAALLVSLAACGQRTTTPPTGQTQTQPLAAAGDPDTETTVFPRHAPYGRGVGAKPGRVVWAYDPDSVEWDGEGYWWEPDHFNEAVMQGMVDNGIASLAGEEDAAAGWDALFRAHNASRGGQGGYQSGQKIAIKTNMNGAGAYDDDVSGNTRESYTNPVLLRALLVSLVTEAGVAPTDITVYDAGRVIPDYLRELCSRTPLEGVGFRYRDIAGPNDAQPDRDAPVVWSESVSGETNYLPACVTEADYLINFANLKGHVYGITLTAKNHFGSILNANRMRAPEAAGLHRYLTQNRMDAYTVLVDLMANHQLGEKTVLYLLDAVICAPGESVSITGENARWQQAPFHGDYTSSLFLSQDGVAIDSVGADFLMNEPTVTRRNSALRDNPNVENYLHEAGLVADAPSGTAYYNGNGQRVTNLGVHEHWNDPTHKQYSRNLGGSEGIELVRIGPGADAPSAGQNPYTDVPTGTWYADAANFCREHGLMNGTSDATFSPDMTTSRAQLTAILWRQAGSPAAGRPPFSDVPADAYYATAAAWAGEQGIVSGYSDGRFAPDDPITRAQLVTLLWRANGSPAATSQHVFADQSAIPSYASAAVAWAQGNGIVSGKSGNHFDPDGSATRAQTATMLYRYLTMDGQSEIPTEPDIPTPSDSDILVAYFSATGTTKTIAEYIAAEQGAVLYEITPEIPYTSVDLNYSDPTSRSQTEQRDASSRPQIAGTLENISQFETVFLGYPVWNGQAPKIIYTFLERYDLSGKTIVPFCTSGSSGMGSSADNLHPLAPTAVWLDGDRFAGGADRATVTRWVNTLDLDGEQKEDTAMPQLTIQVGDQRFTATLEDSETTRALLSRLPMTVTMGELNGNEKFYYLPESLPTRSQRPGTIHAGDLMLYGSDCLVLFYETFASSYSYTRLGSIDDPAGLANALGRGSIEVTFRANE